MATTNADGSTPTDSPNWFGNLFDALGKAAPVAAAWKELVAPVKAAQAPSLGMGSSSPSVITNAAGGQAALNKQPAPSASLMWYLAGGFVLVLIVVLIAGRK